MTDITLYRCHRLDASISKRQCEINRHRKDNILSGTWAVKACKGCPGLGQEVSIDMPEKQEVKVKWPCKISGCAKSAWRSGFCYKHHPDHPSNSSINKEPVPDCITPEVLTAVKRRGRPKNEFVLQVKSPVVADHEIHVVNLVEMYEKKQAADLEEFMAGLNSQPDSLSRLIYACERMS